MQSKERILGIDPGTNVMGYGIIEVENKKLSLVVMNVLTFDRKKSPINRLKDIFDGISFIVEQYHPTQAAIEAPFFGKNVQSMLKLGRAQGVAMAAALYRDIPINEYAPLKIKMAITGNGKASKEQVAYMLRNFLNIPQENMLPQLDATDGLAAAYCHFLQIGKPSSEKSYSGWKDFINKNPEKITKRTIDN